MLLEEAFWLTHLGSLACWGPIFARAGAFFLVVKRYFRASGKYFSVIKIFLCEREQFFGSEKISSHEQERFFGGKKYFGASGSNSLAVENIFARARAVFWR